nr:unnamed protein product [Digitaria exilis]
MRRRHSGLLAWLVLIVCSSCLEETPLVRAQQQAPRTDPIEAAALSTILGRWNAQITAATAARSSPAAWNIRGDPCTGAAVDGTGLDGNNDFNPGITCACSEDDSNNTVCHITMLYVTKVYALNVVGQIPSELQNLTYLTYLNLDQNYLTGPIPSFIGQFSAMQHLGISLDNFSGGLPEELGNLSKLEQLYIDSSGFSGPFPSTFSKLKELRILRASDNYFTGKIPDYFGSLTNLEDIIVGDIVNGSSSFAFVSNLTSLSTLILRNCKLSGNLEAVNLSKLANLILLGYLAPEYAMRGHLTEKADVFAFGVVALETVSGRSNTDNPLEERNIYLLEQAWGMYEGKQPLRIMDPRLEEFDTEEALRVIHVALICTQGSPHQRPTMSRVVAMLTGKAEVVKEMVRPSYVTEWQLRGGNSSCSTSSYWESTTPDFSRRQKEVDPLTLSPTITGASDEIEGR